MATAAYQIEGAWNEGGKGESIWDRFTHQANGCIANNDTGDVAVDHYHLYPVDINLLQQMKLSHYRFSIAWTRIFPTGNGEVNETGVKFYNDLIDALVRAGISPVVTLYHWDLPAHLQDLYGGWLSPTIVSDFERYANMCFQRFGDRVKHWITFNEPWVFTKLGYETGYHAPGLKSGPFDKVFLAGHNVLNAHALAVETYRSKYQKTQQGRIGITLNCDWTEPLDPNSAADISAAQRHIEFQLGWFFDPICFGRYPESMSSLIGESLPQFTPEQRNQIQGSADFLGLNHYTAIYVAHAEDKKTSAGKFRVSFQRNGVPIGTPTDAFWLHITPWGFRSLLKWIHLRYNKPKILITENGCPVPGESSLPIERALDDQFRVDYYRRYLEEMRKAIQLDGVNVVGYFAWSLVDNFEWAEGYRQRFGIHYVDYSDKKLPRYKKKSADFLTNYFNSQQPKL